MEWMALAKRMVWYQKSEITCVEVIHGPEAPGGCQVVTMERVAGAVHLMVRRRRVGGKGQQCGYWFKIYKKGFSMR